MGLKMAGLEPVGVDLAPQPNYPFSFIQSDALALVGAEPYDLVWASPPCQAYTLAQKIRGREHPDLISETREMLKRMGRPYVIENVEGAPLIEPVMLCGAMFGLRTYRHRLFECSFPVRQPEHPEHKSKTTKMGRAPKHNEYMHVVGNFSGVTQAKAAMEIRWMVRDEIRESIPPAYAYYIAEEFKRWRKAGA